MIITSNITKGILKIVFIFNYYNSTVFLLYNAIYSLFAKSGRFIESFACKMQHVSVKICYVSVVERVIDLGLSREFLKF